MAYLHSPRRLAAGLALAFALAGLSACAPADGSALRYPAWREQAAEPAPLAGVSGEGDAISMPLAVISGNEAIPFNSAAGGQTVKIRVTVELPPLAYPVTAGGWMDDQLLFEETVGPGVGLQWSNVYENNGEHLLSVTLDNQLFKSYRVNFDTGEYQIEEDHSDQWGQWG